MSTDRPIEAADGAQPDAAVTTPGRPASDTKTRRVWSRILIGIASVLTVIAILAIWADRQVLNADNWSTTSTQLLQNPAVRATAANYIVDEIYANVNVSQKIGSALPPRLKPLATPLAGALQNGAVSVTELALRPEFQNIWRRVNRATDQQLINIINGQSGSVHFNNGQVTLDLRSVVNQVAAQLGISSDLGAKLPASVANLVVLKSKQLSLVQDFGRALKGLSLILTILVPLLFAAALAVAPPSRRRRTLMTIGICGVVVGLIVVLIRSIIVGQVPPALTSDASMQATASAVVSIATSLLTQIAGGVVFIGAVLIACSWFAGPASWAVAARRWLAPHAETHPGGMFAVVAGILLILFIWQPFPATGKPIGMLVFTILAMVGTEILRRQMLREFPSAHISLPGSSDAGGVATA